MPLPDLLSGMLIVEETLGELAHRRSRQRSAALDALRSLHGVGGELGGVIVDVGGAAAARLTLVDLDQLAPVVDAHQLAVQPDLHLLTRWTGRCWHRVQRVLTGHMMVGMHLGRAPVDDLVGLAIPGSRA